MDNLFFSICLTDTKHPLLNLILPETHPERWCNDPFSRFEKQTLILEKLAEATDPTTERHGNDGPSRVSRPKTLRKSKIWY